MLIVNADDFGRSKGETDAALACYQAGRITSATAMMFMADSERAAELAKGTGLDVGLHLNFTETFSTGCSPEVAKSQNRIVRYLKRSKYAQLIYNPILRREFRCCYKSQAEEFVRLYGKSPSHVDGHHHMHLCANMLFSKAIPRGTKM